MQHDYIILIINYKFIVNGLHKQYASTIVKIICA